MIIRLNDTPINESLEKFHDKIGSIMQKLNVESILISRKLFMTYIVLRYGTNIEALIRNFLDENMIDTAYIINNHEAISFYVIVKSGNGKQSAKLLTMKYVSEHQTSCPTQHTILH